MEWQDWLIRRPTETTYQQQHEILLNKAALLAAVFYLECFSNQLSISSNLILPEAMLITNSYFSS